jgi:hypothetical protein
MKQLVLLLFGLLCWQQVIAQNHQVSGKITDGDGSVLPGVTVLVKGTNQGTASDATGMFALEAAPQHTLIFSFIGYVSQEVPVGNKTAFQVSLVPDARQLSEVVVTALGFEEAADKVAATSSKISGESIQNKSKNAPAVAMLVPVPVPA